ncbi:Alba DNA/RNA-binding protein [Perilla frutescens var. hirtella]|uniref:Alba DNA/RNA-binding protein n=1 Tax=Perilla frutescens var. hirtella TaxID=608512 RepID=A0AAD4NZP1_PERFH|nr:Alba DNA/RNA-binding protein [Perilla frutescens var. hirtella]
MKTDYDSYSYVQDKQEKEIILKAMGQAISKAVAIAEFIKKRIPGLHQNISTSSTTITDAYEPIEEGLSPLEMKRQVSLISIALSTLELNNTSPGYQAPNAKQAEGENQQEQQNKQSIVSSTDVGEENSGYYNWGEEGGRGRGRGGYGDYQENSGYYNWGEGGGRGRGRGGYGDYQEYSGYYNWGEGGGRGRGRGRGWGYRGAGYERGRGGGRGRGRGYGYGRGRGAANQPQ